MANESEYNEGSKYETVMEWSNSNDDNKTQSNYVDDDDCNGKDDGNGSSINQSQEETNLSKSLPPEFWTTILDQLKSQQEIVNCRLISRHLKLLVDTHCTFQVKINETLPRSIPGPHVKICDLFIRNWTTPITTTTSTTSTSSTESSSDKNYYNNGSRKLMKLNFENLDKLKTLTVMGPTHLSVVQMILSNAMNLEVIKIETLSFGLHQSPPSSSFASVVPHDNSGDLPSVRHLRKMTHLSLFKRDSFRFHVGEAGEEREEEYCFVSNFNQVRIIEKFAHTVTSVLKAPILLPWLVKLNLEFDELPILTLQELCHSTIIPFVKTHAETLKVLQINLTPPLYRQLTPFARDPHDAYFPTQTSGTTSMSKLNTIYLLLPEAVLNGMLVAFFDKRNIPINILEQFVTEWRGPYRMAANDQQQDGLYVFQQLVAKNADSLVQLNVQGLNASNLMLFESDRGIQTYSKLTELRIEARIPLHADPDALVPQIVPQSKLCLQNFPSLEDISLTNIGVELESLKNWILSCQELDYLQIDGLYYANDCNINLTFLEDIVTKPGMKEISVNVQDLREEWDSVYWDDIRLFSIDSCEIDAADFLVIRP